MKRGLSTSAPSYRLHKASGQARVTINGKTHYLGKHGTQQELTPVLADMVEVHRLIGARPSEMCNLRPCDIDRSEAVWIYTPASHKTEHHGHSRKIAIGPKAQAVLARYLLRDPQAFCFSP